MISGSGQAFQPNSTSGSVGDILGLSTYVSGLSGGSWAVGTYFANDGQNPDQLAQNVSLECLVLSLELTDASSGLEYRLESGCSF